MMFCDEEVVVCLSKDDGDDECLLCLVICDGLCDGKRHSN